MPKNVTMITIKNGMTALNLSIKINTLLLLLTYHLCGTLRFGAKGPSKMKKHINLKYDLFANYTIK